MKQVSKLVECLYREKEMEVHCYYGGNKDR